MKKFVILNTPTKLPILYTVLPLFMLDYYKAPRWAWGVAFVLIGLNWLMRIAAILNEKRVDINKEMIAGKQHSALYTNKLEFLARLQMLFTNPKK